MSDLESRLAALEAALALPHQQQAAAHFASADLQQRAKLEKELLKAHYRTQHLVRSYDAQVREIAALKAELAALSTKKS